MLPWEEFQRPAEAPQPSAEPKPWEEFQKVSTPEPSLLDRAIHGGIAAAEAPRAFIRNLAAAGTKGLLESVGSSKLTRDVLGIPENPLPGQIANWMSYQPQTQEAQTGLRVLGLPGELYKSKVTQPAGQWAESVTGSPMVGEMVTKGLEIAPYGIGRVPGGGLSPAAEAMRAAGFKISPIEPGAGGPVSRGLAGLSGEARLARAISQKNEPLTQNLIAGDFGLPADTAMTREGLKTVEKTAGKAYEAVKNTGQITADGQYLNDLIAIRDKFAPAATELGGKTTIFSTLKGIANEKFSARAAVDRIGQLREDASNAFRAGNGQEGAAYKAMESALEAQLGRHLVATGQDPALITGWQEARTTIAKAKMAQEALNEVTGQIKPSVYGSAAKEGLKMTGGAKTVGEMAATFPRSMQLGTVYQGTGPTLADAAAGLLAKTYGSPGLGWDIATIGARPAIRGLLASGAGQAAMGKSLPMQYGLLPGLYEQP